MKKNPILTLSSASFSYANQRIFTDLSLDVFSGEKIALLGANGSGKSTLLKILNGLYFPQFGSYTAFGRQISESAFGDVQAEWEFRSKIGFVFQDPDVQLFCPTVWDEVAFGPLHIGIPDSEVIYRTNTALKTLNIFHLRTRPPYTLSGGEKKKVALASVLSMSPRVWLLDEPTASLDPKTQSVLIDFLNERNKKGDTIITTTHDLVLLSEIADRVIVMSENHTIAADGTAESIGNDTALLLAHNLIHEHTHMHKAKQHTHRHIHGPFTLSGEHSKKH